MTRTSPNLGLPKCNSPDPRLTGTHGEKAVARLVLEWEPTRSCQAPSSLTTALPPARNNQEAARNSASARDRALSPGPAGGPGFRSHPLPGAHGTLGHSLRRSPTLFSCHQDRTRHSQLNKTEHGVCREDACGWRDGDPGLLQGSQRDSAAGERGLRALRAGGKGCLGTWGCEGWPTAHCLWSPRRLA